MGKAGTDAANGTSDDVKICFRPVRSPVDMNDQSIEVSKLLWVGQFLLYKSGFLVCILLFSIKPRLSNVTNA